MSTPAIPTVEILLAVHNGERFLGEQLASIDAQTGVHTRLWVGDDASIDSSAALVQRHLAARGGRDHWRAVQCRNGTRNFMQLLAWAVDATRDEAARGHSTGPGTGGQWFAWCDQDDIWLSHKLQRALAQLDAAGQRADGPPCLYGARTLVVDEANQPIGPTRLFARPPSFGNALVQNIMAGNTMVFNRAAAELLAACADTPLHLHDWWTYLLVCGAGGRVVFDAEPCLRYRQHGRNQIGSHVGLRAALLRLGRFWRGDYRLWNLAYLGALQRHAALLTPQAGQQAAAWREASLAPGAITRWRALRASGVQRQSRVEQAILSTACVLGRLRD